MIRAIVLDSGVLALATQRKGVPEADACRQWIRRCLRAGVRILVPAIADYETRRELLRVGKSAGIVRLDAFIGAVPDRYVVLTDAALRLAAELWAECRRQGRPTADPKELDVDVVLAAQALSLDTAPDSVVVATTNVGHLSRFVDAQPWTAIVP